MEVVFVTWPGSVIRLTSVGRIHTIPAYLHATRFSTDRTDAELESKLTSSWQTRKKMLNKLIISRKQSWIMTINRFQKKTNQYHTCYFTARHFWKTSNKLKADCDRHIIAAKHLTVKHGTLRNVPYSTYHLRLRRALRKISTFEQINVLLKRRLRAPCFHVLASGNVASRLNAFSLCCIWSCTCVKPLSTFIVSAGVLFGAPFSRFHWN